MAYYIYMMTNRAGTLYTGVTNDLEHRVYEHIHGAVPGFTSRYSLNRLIYYEETSDVGDAISREKQIKGWLRRKKVELVDSMNPLWVDLAEAWHSERPDPSLRSG